MIFIDFDNRGGGGSGGGVTSGEVQTMINNSIEDKQNLYTASTKEDLTGLTDSHEGDVVVISNYKNNIGWSNSKGNVYETNFWCALSGKTINIGFNWDFYNQYADILTADTLYCNLVFQYWTSDYTQYIQQYYQIKDEYGTLYFSTGDTADNWQSWDGTPLVAQVPNIPEDRFGVSFEMNNYNFGIDQSENLLYLAEIIPTAAFQKIEGSWFRLVDFMDESEVKDMLNPITSQMSDDWAHTQKRFDNKLWNDFTISEDGTIITIPNSVGGTNDFEVFKHAEKYLERKGVYNRSVNVTAITDFNDAEEGDIALVSTVSGTATTHTHYTYNEGKWSMPVVSDEINKIKVIDVVGFGLITEKDPKTLYNVVESERVIAADPVSIVLENSGGSATVNVYALDTYTVSGDSFFTVSGTPASGLTTLTIQATGANESNSAITGNCTLTCSGSTVVIPVTQKPNSQWLPLSSVSNTQAVNAIAWGENFYSERMDNWLSEVSGLTSESMGWNDGTNAELGWFADHRWNASYFAFRWEHTEGSWADDVDRSTLPEETIDVNGSSVSVHVYDFANVQNAVPLYPAYSDGSLYGSDVYVRTA